MNYENPTPVAIALIPVLGDNGSMYLLGVQRGIEPFIGGIALPGGYINKGENVNMAVTREVLEETGLNLNQNDFLLTENLISPENKLLLFCRYQEVQMESLIDMEYVDTENQKLVLISKDTPICFSLHKKIIDDFFSNKKPY